MYVGSVYWFLSMATDLSDHRVTIFDCESETIVWDSKNCDVYDIVNEVDYAGFGDYEVDSYDLWTDANTNQVHLEINITIEKDDE